MELSVLWNLQLQLQVVKLLQQAERLPLFPKECCDKRVTLTGIELFNVHECGAFKV
jgi:hypothetical protein